jgi:hypothetical protein
VGFVKVPGLIGRVYVPEAHPDDAQKYPCRDCYVCQMCGENRCTVCRNRRENCPQEPGKAPDHADYKG